MYSRSEQKKESLAVFNGTDGKRLRLSIENHVVKQQKDQQYCALCGIRGIEGNHSGWRGHRTTYQCVQCDVFVCTRIYPGNRMSCCELWHSAIVLKPRCTPRPARASTRPDPNDQDDDEGVEEEHYQSRTAVRDENASLILMCSILPQTHRSFQMYHKIFQDRPHHIPPFPPGTQSNHAYSRPKLNPTQLPPLLQVIWAPSAIPQILPCHQYTTMNFQAKTQCNFFKKH